MLLDVNLREPLWTCLKFLMTARTQRESTVNNHGFHAIVFDMVANGSVARLTGNPHMFSLGLHGNLICVAAGTYIGGAVVSG